MSAALLDRPAPGTEDAAARAGFPEIGRGITVYGDFNCPWSYLAYRRSAVLAASGIEIDWRAVEHAPWTPGRADDRPARFTEVREEMGRVASMLLPGERLPYDLAGFLPRTRASIAAYAEAYAAGVADPARRVIFESFWMHGVDIGDARVLRTLLVDELRSGHSPNETVRAWGHAVDVTGGPLSTEAWHLVGHWSEQWHDTHQEVVPVVQVAGERPIFGVEAVEWLGDEIAFRGLEPELAPVSAAGWAAPGELPSRTWLTENGGRWLDRSRQAGVGRRDAG